MGRNFRPRSLFSLDCGAIARYGAVPCCTSLARSSHRRGDRALSPGKGESAMPSRKQLEKLTAKYMKEIRDADAAKLSLREYLREGLVGGAAGLIALQGMRNFRPFWAHASH